MRKKIFFENLDGLRFFCFLSVFFHHSFFAEFDHIKNSSIYHFIKKDLFRNGNIGVNFFFVLSGFLITYLLIEEKKLNGQINLKNFYLRRVLRIWPLYFFCVLFGFFIFPQIKIAFGQTPHETASIWYFISFLSNFDFIRTEPDASVLGALWSVSIEEQFYLVWPIIMFILPIKRYHLAFIGIIITCLLFRALNDIGIVYEYHTLSCIGDMAMGAFGSWLIQEKNKFKMMIVHLKKYQVAIIYSLFIFVFFFRNPFMYSAYFLRIFERSFVAIIILFIILEQTYCQHSFFKLSKFKAISKLGVISYGLYCLHFVGILIATTITKKLGMNTHLWQVVFIDTSLALTITILISQFSYRFFETPFLKLKEKFAYFTK